MKNSLEIVVLGGGSFGTVLCNMVAENGHRATLWLRNEERASEINREHRNSRYLPNFLLNDQVHASTDLAACLQRADLVFVAVPSHSCREVAEQIAHFAPSDALIVSTTKGIEAANFSLMSQVLVEYLPNHAIGVLSGPNLAREIIARQMTATVIASEDERLVDVVQQALHCAFFRVYGSRDVFGVELGGALKNIYAIIAGVAAAMSLGENTRAMLLTRSLAEMSRFAVTMGANPLTFLGLAGVGDLIVTCSSPLSRNFQVGQALGQGKTLEQSVAELGQVAEGVNTLRLVKQKADELGVYMPLVQGLYRIVFDHCQVADVVSELMLGEQNDDVEFSLAP